MVIASRPPSGPTDTRLPVHSRPACRPVTPCRDARRACVPPARLTCVVHRWRRTAAIWWAAAGAWRALTGATTRSERSSGSSRRPAASPARWFGQEWAATLAADHTDRSGSGQQDGAVGHDGVQQHDWQQHVQLGETFQTSRGSSPAAAARPSAARRSAACAQRVGTRLDRVMHACMQPRVRWDRTRPCSTGHISQLTCASGSRAQVADPARTIQRAHAPLVPSRSGGDPSLGPEIFRNSI